MYIIERGPMMKREEKVDKDTIYTHLFHYLINSNFQNIFSHNYRLLLFCFMFIYMLVIKCKITQPMQCPLKLIRTYCTRVQTLETN